MRNNSKGISVNALLKYIPWLVIFFYLLLFVINGENTPIRIHDNLDSGLVQYKVLADSGIYFYPFDATLPQMVTNLPRSSYPPALNIITLLFYLFPPYSAYVINQLLIRITAYLGMSLLLKSKYKNNHQLVTEGIALLFSLLPFWPLGGLSVAGQPLALYAFGKIRNQCSKWYDWVILFLIPFYSSWILSLLFVMIYVFFILIKDTVILKKINYQFLKSIVVMGIASLISTYELVYSMLFDQNYTSQREAWQSSRTNLIDVNQFLQDFFENMINGQYHAQPVHKYIIVPIVIISIIMALFKKKDRKGLNYALLPIVAFSIFISAYSAGLGENLESISRIFAAFNWTRFSFMFPVFWYIAFAESLLLLKQTLKFRNIVIIVLILQITVLFAKSEVISAYRMHTPTYKSFYATDLFNQIDQYIGIDKTTYRVASLALFPAIANYNGFYTIDGYFSTYPLEYKIRFRKIIEKELAKNDELRKYYDEWGSRAYIFSDEIGENFMLTKQESGFSLDNLELDSQAMNQLGCKYLLSAVRINNAEASNLTYMRSFEDTESSWVIYLYSISNNN